MYDPFKKKAVTVADRRAIAERFGCKPGKRVAAKCAYCDFVGHIEWVLEAGRPGWVIFDRLEIEHIHPEFQGGAGGGNLTLSCRRCNRSKGARTVEQWQSK